MANKTKTGKLFRPNSFEIEIGGSAAVFGRNAVKEALSGDRNISAVYVQKGSKGAIEPIIEKAKRAGVKVEFVEKSALDKAAAGVPHQGIMCLASPYEYRELRDVLSEIDEALSDGAQSTEGKLPLLVILDGIEDPHNLGAIMRSAECVGAAGIIVPKRHSAPLNETVARTSAGAIEHIPCIQVSNIVNAMELLKEHGYWIYACDMGGENLWETAFDGKVAIVIGNEGSGVSRLVREKCDFIVSIPMRGKIDSLNASNAACVVMYEVLRKIVR